MQIPAEIPITGRPAETLGTTSTGIINELHNILIIVGDCSIDTDDKRNTWVRGERMEGWEARKEHGSRLICVITGQRGVDEWNYMRVNLTAT